MTRSFFHHAIAGIFFGILLSPPLVFGQADEALASQSARVALTVNSARSASEARRNILSRAEKSPVQEILATVVFDRGLTNGQFSAFVKEYDVRLEGATAKEAVENDVYTFMFNDVSAPSRTDVDAILDQMGSRHRQALERTGDSIAREAEEQRGLPNTAARTAKYARHNRQLQKRALRYFDAKVVGRLSSMADMLKDPRVLVVVSHTEEEYQRVLEAQSQRRTPPTKTTPLNEVHSETRSSGANSENTQFSLLAASLCGPGGPEANCPPDYSWLPPDDEVNSFTYIANYGGGDTGYDPYKQGYTHSYLSWDTANDAQNPGFKRNTLAYKASHLPECNPEITAGLHAPCGGSTPQSDVTFVPASTYEHDTNIENWTCSSTRTGTNVDRSYGCFVWSYAASNLPSAYADTTFQDPPYDYSAAIGTVDPQSLVEGNNYMTYLEFWAWEHEDFTGKRVRLYGQVGSEYAIPAPVAFRVFGVDTTKILEQVLLPLP